MIEASLACIAGALCCIAVALIRIERKHMATLIVTLPPPKIIIHEGKPDDNEGEGWKN